MYKKLLNRRAVLAAGGKGAAFAGLMALPFGNGVMAQEDADLTLRFAVADFGGNLLDPSIGKGETQAIVCCMYDGWFRHDLENGQLVPSIIDSWELSEDGHTWTFHVRDDVVFHDGSPVTAEDFIFSLNAAQRDVAWQTDLAKVSFGYPPRTELVDTHTFRLTTPEPSPRLVTMYSNLTTPHLFVLPKAYIEEHGWDHFYQNPIGTGPYRFVRLVENDMMEFEAVDYPHWTGYVPDFKRVIVTLVPEEATRMFMLETGEIDGTHGSVENAINAQNRGFNVLTGARGQSQLNFIGMYLPEAEDSPLADVRVREALSLAINRQELSDTLLGGLGSVPKTQQALNLRGDDVAPWLAEKWEPRMEHLYRYDPDEARRLIAEAGYENGFSQDIWTAPDTSAPFLHDIMIALASYWSRVGFNANIISVDSAAWQAARRPPRSFQLVGKAGASATSLAKPIAIERLQYWTTDGGTLNLMYGGELQPKLDELYALGQATVDIEEYTRIVDEGLELTTPTWTCVSIIDAPLPTILNPRVEGIMAPGSAYWSEFFVNWKHTAA